MNNETGAPAEPDVGPAASGDFVVAATFSTPTEAFVLRGVLEAAELTPFVADANLGQAHPWLTHAVGGVRVMVPAAQRDEALSLIARWRAGELQLEGTEPAEPERTQPLAQPIFSPDAAAVWSFVLTPVFGALLHLLNARRLEEARLQRIAWGWLIALSAITVAAVPVSHRLVGDMWSPFRASVSIFLVTLVWYFGAGQVQSRLVLERHGRRYPRRPLFLPAAAWALALSVLGWVVDTLL